MPRTSSRRAAAPSLAPLFAMLLLALGGIGAAGFFHGVKRDQQEAQAADNEAQEAARTAAAAAPDPFASIAEELPPSHERPLESTPAPVDPFANVDRAPSSSRSSLPQTPLEASSDADWERCLQMGRQADVLAAAARRAKARDDHAVFQEKGKAAKKAYDQAFTDSIELELAWIEAHGEQDPRVRRMVAVRNAWQDAMGIFHRTTGR